MDVFINVLGSISPRWLLRLPDCSVLVFPKLFSASYELYRWFLTLNIPHTSPELSLICGVIPLLPILHEGVSSALQVQAEL